MIAKNLVESQLRDKINNAVKKKKKKKKQTETNFFETILSW